MLGLLCGCLYWWQGMEDMLLMELDMLLVELYLGLSYCIAYVTAYMIHLACGDSSRGCSGSIEFEKWLVQ
jgi:hypothetical protein